jgi:hypothetical protein
MTIGIIGAGAIGGAFARALAKANIEAVLSNSRGPESLAGLAKEIGAPIRLAPGRKRRRRTLFSSR